MSWHPVLYALSTAYTNHSTHWVQHQLNIVSLPFTLMTAWWAPMLGWAFGLPRYMIHHTQGALHGSSKKKWSCRIPTVGRKRHVQQSFNTRQADYWLTPSARLLSLHQGFQVHFQTGWIKASKCLTKVFELHPPSSHVCGLDLHVQTLTIPASKCISHLTRLQPPSASSNWITPSL